LEGFAAVAAFALFRPFLAAAEQGWATIDLALLGGCFLDFLVISIPLK
jgi:hypothetical protein